MLEWSMNRLLLDGCCVAEVTPYGRFGPGRAIWFDHWRVTVDMRGTPLRTEVAPGCGEARRFAEELVRAELAVRALMESA